jgi:hypothetical protein
MANRFWRMMGRYDSETTAYTPLAGAGGISPFTPDFTGKLVGLRGIVGGGAATSLVNAIQFRLSCTMFKPNAIEAGAQGCGLQTAVSPVTHILDWVCDQPVQAGVPIMIEGRNNNAETPVTVDAMLWGCFEIS